MGDLGLVQGDVAAAEIPTGMLSRNGIGGSHWMPIGTGHPHGVIVQSQAPVGYHSLHVSFCAFVGIL
jgi:hypothetical protein